MQRMMVETTIASRSKTMCSTNCPVTQVAPTRAGRLWEESLAVKTRARPRALHATDLSAFGEQGSDESRNPSDTAAKNDGKHLCLALVGPVVDENTGATLGLSCPEIAFPSSHPNEAQSRV